MLEKIYDRIAKFFSQLEHEIEADSLWQNPRHVSPPFSKTKTEL